MVENHWTLTKYLSRTTIDAAAAGLQLMDWIAAIDENISYNLTNGRIQFKAKKPFCTLHPHSDAITCHIHTNGHSQSMQLIHLSDLNETVQQQINQAYRYACS